MQTKLDKTWHFQLGDLDSTNWIRAPEPFFKAQIVANKTNSAISWQKKQAGDEQELIEFRRGSETWLRGSFYSTQETSLTGLFFTLVILVSETDFLPLQIPVSQR